MRNGKNIASVFLLLIGIFNVNAKGISVMSYNIRMDTPNDGENQWMYRKADVVKLIRTYHPDFFGLQEAMYHQRNFIDSCLMSYNQIGVGRDDGKNKGEATPIFYNSKKYKLIEHSTFWLSDTPQKVGLGWDASYNRTCTYGQFEHKKSRQIIWVFNTHFDHKGEVARQNSAKLILSKIKTLVGENDPVILVGDFNATPDSRAYQVITSALNDAWSAAKKASGPNGTFNGFKPIAKLENRIDYVFSKHLKTKISKHISDKRKNGLWVSDHLPIYTKLKTIKSYHHE